MRVFVMKRDSGVTRAYGWPPRRHISAAVWIRGNIKQTTIFFKITE